MAFPTPNCAPTVDKCLVDFLLTLTAPELMSLRALINSVLTLTSTLKDLLIFRISRLDYLRILYNALLSPVLAIQNVFLAGLGLLPVDRSPDCAGLAEVVGDIMDFVKQFNPRVSDIEDFLDQLDVAQEALQKQLDDLLNFEDYTGFLIDCIDQVILYVEQVRTQS